MAPMGNKKPMKPSKVVKPQKDKRRSTISHKNHRFQSFSERISKLKIDPIRRRRIADDAKELSQTNHTYFGTSLEEWRDLNMSKTFTSFAKDASLLCDGLALVLHNKDQIMNLLVEHIQRADPLALEALLSLLSHFARDLDIRFEKHFARAVSTVIAVAANNSDPAVVEWCFNSLAWQFKYLSRVLVPDLRPLYDLMSNYLGKQQQKPYIIRFAAESLSFLIRKAATVYERDANPLNTIVSHIMQDLEDSSANASFELYQQGVMTLFTEAIKGMHHSIHAIGIAILESILENTFRNAGQQSTSLPTVTGTVTSLIHHTNAETFRPILQLALRSARNALESGQRDLLGTYNQILFTVVSVRQGSRVSDWPAVFSLLRTEMDLGRDSRSMDDEARKSLLSTLAVSLQSAPVGDVLPAISLFTVARSGDWAPSFLQFCDLFARLGQERFHRLLLPDFQKFVVDQWQQYGDGIIRILPKLPIASKEVELPFSLQEKLLRLLARHPSSLSDDTRKSQLHEANNILAALKLMDTSDGSRQRLRTDLSVWVEETIKSSESPDEVALAVGPCFAALLESGMESNDISCLRITLCKASSRFVGSTPFWLNLRRYFELCAPRPEYAGSSEMASLEEAILEALASSFHEIREAALQILHKLYILRTGSAPEIFSTATAIESTPISLETSRHLAMNIRRLALGYHTLGEDLLLQKAVPRYCFGLLHIQLASAWDEAVKALAEMSTSAIAEDIITELSQKWLQGPPAEAEEQSPQQQVLDISLRGFQVVSDFECSNLAKLSAICQQVFEEPYHGYLSPAEQFQHDLNNVPLVASNARQQGLKVLHSMPPIAEKKSRMLVPVLLSWAAPSAPTDDAESWSHGWSRKDQKALLAIFAQFQNPKVLYRSAEVYEALLSLCGNGDVEVQQSALKALFAWKDPVIIKCREHLENLLDEARFRDEIAVFLNGNFDEDALVTKEDHPALLPVLLRLLYGRVVAGGKEGQKARRRTVFSALATYGEEALSMFIDISLAAAKIPTLGTEVGISQAIERLESPPRQQFGMLNMLDDMLETLASKLEPFALKLVNAVLVCTVAASRRLDSDDDSSNLTDGSLVRSVRGAGMQCLAKIYSSMPGTDLSAQSRIVAAELFVPRLDKFATENTQSISGTLRLLSAWASSLRTAKYLAEEMQSVIASIADLLRQESAKDDVRLFVLRDVLAGLLQDGVLLEDAHITAFIRSIGAVIDRQPSGDVLEASVTSFTMLADLINGQEEADAVIEVCSSLLMKPTMVVSPSSKVGLLQTALVLLDKFQAPGGSPMYIAVCGLFSRIRDDQSRSLLAKVFSKLCAPSEGLSKVAQICGDLNATSNRLDEPDLERRESGFVKIYEQYDSFSLQQWQPIVHNCLFYIRDAEDMVNRSNAARVLGRCVEVASERQGELSSLIISTVLPGIERGIAEKSELVRAEYAQLLGQVVEKLPQLASLSDMQVLTMDGDDEASFFENILHIQQHRRLRALRRLAEEAPKLNSHNVTKYLIPLLEHFVLDPAEGDAGRTLQDQTIATIGALGAAMKWSSLKAAFLRYTRLLKKEPAHEKVTLRLAGVLVDALRNNNNGRATASGSEVTAKADIITRDFLPPLLGYLHLKDESTVDRRMPVAVTIVKLLQLLPESELSIRLAPVLTDVCHVLRSRRPEARDQTRKALAAILALVGPQYFGFILKELRGALQRGYQLHVLSYTVHSLLVHAIDSYKPGDLDHCLSEITAVVMDDIFGVTGQEKEAEEYKSSMKEIKSSKSFDTMELLACITPVQELGLVTRPIRALLQERLDSQSAKKVDGLLDRLRRGLDQNPAAGSREMLMFCHEVMRNSNSEPPVNASHSKELDERRKRYLIQPEPGSNSRPKSTATAHTYKLVSFALNLLRRVLRRHEDLQTPSNLHGFVPMISEVFVQPQEEVQLAATRLLGTIMRVPMPALEENAPVYVNEAVRQIKAATSMTSDAAKAALELVTAVLREQRSVTVRNNDIGKILKAIKADIDEPDRQGIIYKFIRAVLGRKIMITEVYELMEEIKTVLVTNPDRNVREGARSAYIQFIMDYPQGKDRWKKQTAFFVDNLEYEHASGRQSTMEVLHRLLTKVSDEIFAQLMKGTLFAALVRVRVSDVDHDCRQMASVLLSTISQRADGKQQSEFLTTMNGWLKHQDNAAIQSAGLQCWQILLVARLPEIKRLEQLRNDLANILAALDDQGEATTLVIHDALKTFAVLLETAPAVALAKESADIWKSLQSCLRVGSADSQGTAARLLEAYFSDLASTSSKLAGGLASVPLVGSHGLKLTADDMRQLCYGFLRILRTTTESDEPLRNQAVRNLAFLGRCFTANGIAWRDQEDTPDPSAVAYLFNRLSYIIRQDSMTIASRSAALDCQISLINHVTTIPDLHGTLRPAYALTDATNPRQPTENVLVEKARELLNLVQKKIGSESYLSTLSAVRTEVKAKREERRQKRKVEAVTAPGKSEKRKKQKHDMRKTALKARGLEARGKRRGW